MSKRYRKGVGVFLLNQNKKLWVGKRMDLNNEYWQMPQGGIDGEETPVQAMKRELMEETGLEKNYKIIGKTNNWLKYNLPENLVNVVWEGKYLGQEQIWFACSFLGNDNQININLFKKPEFCKWKWIDPLDSLRLVVPFKRRLYKSIIDEFSIFFN